jgi:hypothetical protein
VAFLFGPQSRRHASGRWLDNAQSLSVSLVLGRRLGYRLCLTLPRFFHGLGYWLASAIIGGLALTLFYMFVVVPLKTGTLPSNMGGLFIIGFILNAAWGIGWALLLVLFDRILGRKTRLSTRGPIA